MVGFGRKGRTFRGTVQTITKAGRVLDLFSIERPEWGVSEVAQALKYSKSSISELMSALAKQGLLRQTGERRYRLGWRVMALSQILLETTEFRTEAWRAMEHLVSLTGETVHLAALEANQVIYLDKLQGTRAINVNVTYIGARFPAHCSAVGKAILAHLPWERALEILEVQGMKKFTPNTITTPEELRGELQRVREQGYAYDLEEAELELRCVGAPIRNHSGEVVASMSLAVSAYRFGDYKEKYRDLIVSTTQKVSEKGRGSAAVLHRHVSKPGSAVLGRLVRLVEILQV
jgi:DNA-binding IclR family transcriptional regulator